MTDPATHYGITAHGRAIHLKPARAEVLGPALCGRAGMIWYAAAENRDFAARVALPMCKSCWRRAEVASEVAS